MAQRLEKYSTKMHIVMQMVRCSDVTRYAGVAFYGVSAQAEGDWVRHLKATRNLRSDQFPIQQPRGPVSVTVQNFSNVNSFFQGAVSAFHMTFFAMGKGHA